jgi:hypothetical protein
MHIAAVLPLAILPFAFAANHTVDVGVDANGKPGLFFTPDKLNPAVNDTVVFRFYSDNHSVAQSTFQNPCEFAENAIFSGFPGNVRFHSYGSAMLCLTEKLTCFIT